MHRMGPTTPKTLNDLREAGIFIGPAPGDFWNKFDRFFLGALVTAAILATAAFAVIVTKFVH